MKRFTILLLIIICLISCKKKECKGVICLNGTECNFGECSCGGEYEGSDCGTETLRISYTLSKTENNLLIVKYYSFSGAKN